MPLVTSAAAAMQRCRQVHVNGRDYTLAEYVGAAPTKGIYVDGNEVNDNGLPQGFLVIQPPGAVTPAHFHDPQPVPGVRRGQKAASVRTRSVR